MLAHMNFALETKELKRFAEYKMILLEWRVLREIRA
jgi:hypothetical protein